LESRFLAVESAGLSSGMSALGTSVSATMSAVAPLWRISRTAAVRSESSKLTLSGQSASKFAVMHNKPHRVVGFVASKEH
jgi:hypothetical protein